MKRYHVSYDIKKQGVVRHFEAYRWAVNAAAVRDSIRDDNNRRRAEGRSHMFHVEVHPAPEPSNVKALGRVLGQKLLPRV